MRYDFKQFQKLIKKFLPHITILSGNEPYQKEKLIQLIRSHAEKHQIEIIKHTTSQGINEASLYDLTMNLSLFATARLFIIRFDQLPDASTQKTLAAFFEKQPDMDYYLLVLPKLRVKQTKQSWFSRMTTHAVYVAVWQPDIEESFHFIQTLAYEAKLNLSNEMLKKIAHAYEGNLSGASQAIELLANQNTSTPSEKLLNNTLYQGAFYTLFDYRFHLICGNVNKALTILNGLTAQGLELPVILWAIMKELRILIKLHHCQTHKDMSTLFSQEKIWRNKQRYYHYAKQLFSIEQLYELLSDCFHIDLVIKGHAKGEALFELRQITARFLAKDG